MTAAACGSGTVPSAEASPTTTAAPTTTTAAPTTTTAAPSATTQASAEPDQGEIVLGADPDVDAVVEAYTIVFDSATPYEEKVPYLVAPEGLEETVVAYSATGDSVGGVSVAVTAVEAEGETAAVVYTLLFGDNPVYPNLQGDAVRSEGRWQITREMFCSLMTSARVGCPDQ